MTAASGPQQPPGGVGGPDPTQHTPQPTEAATEADRCRSCGAPVLWRRSEGFGRWAPIDAVPNPAGNVLLLPEGRFRVLAPPSLLEPEPRGLRYMPHHASCPQGSAWRRR